MKILVLQASPNLDGSTRLLAENFERGALEAGHEVEILDIDQFDIHPCTGCVRCGYEGPCIQKDDVKFLKNKILKADMLVFATPLYYYGMTAQLKALIDRFCAFNTSLNKKNLKSALITVAWNNDDWTFDAIKAHYNTLVRYLNFEDQGSILGYGCGMPSMTEDSVFPQMAYNFGKEL